MSKPRNRFDLDLKAIHSYIFSALQAVTIEDGAYSDVVSKEDKEMKSPSDIVSEMETVVVSSNTEVQVEEGRGKLSSHLPLRKVQLVTSLQKLARSMILA